MGWRKKFTIPSLVAAGLSPIAAAAADDQASTAPRTGDSLFDQMKGIATSIDDAHTFSLAAHRSHGSHGSHESHQSHRSSGYYTPPPGSEGEIAVASLTTRNEKSTPANSVLPSSPAIAKKLKPLPGNSEKFRDIVMRAQLALLARGYQVGEINGELHARTVAALYSYQRDAGQIPSGKLTNEALSSLGIVAQ